MYIVPKFIVLCNNFFDLLCIHDLASETGNSGPVFLSIGKGQIVKLCQSKNASRID